VLKTDYQFLPTWYLTSLFKIIDLKYLTFACHSGFVPRLFSETKLYSHFSIQEIPVFAQKSAKPE
jgi:hypothetical protein